MKFERPVPRGAGLSRFAACHPARRCATIIVAMIGLARPASLGRRRRCIVAAFVLVLAVQQVLFYGFYAPIFSLAGQIE